MNQGHEYRSRIGADGDGRPLLAWLAERYAHTTVGEWESRIEAGLVQVEGRAARPSDRLRTGDRLVWRRPGWEEPEAPLTFTVLLEDEDLLAVSKPSGLPTLPGAGFLESTLLYLVRERSPRAAPLHRLGRFTSGIVLFARDASARAALSRQWAEGTVLKRYRALATGTPDRDGFSVTTPIGPVPHALLGSVHGATQDGKPATTDVRVLERCSGTFLCDVALVTGRPHQIRIHLAAAGHPLVGDPLYACGGLPAPACRALPGDPGYLLHAAELRFSHPRSLRPVVILSAPPATLENAAEEARSSAPSS